MGSRVLMVDKFNVTRSGSSSLIPEHQDRQAINTLLGYCKEVHILAYSKSWLVGPRPRRKLKPMMLSNT